MNRNSRYIRTMLFSITCMIGHLVLAGCFNRCESDAECDDRKFCTGPEHCGCGASWICWGGPSCNSAGSPCVNPTPICDESKNSCLPCENDEQCIGIDPLDCTDDSCNQVTGACEHRDNCPDDGIFCNGTEYCWNYAPGTCVHSGRSCFGTTPICDEVEKSCVPCQGDEQCIDSLDCTDDSCNQVTGECEHRDNCPDDGFFCNGTEYCWNNGPGTCEHSGRFCFGTTPVCDEVEKSCLPCQSDEQCDDSYSCTVDACDIVTGQCTNPYCPDDGDPCTFLSCEPSESGEACNHRPIFCERSEDCYSPDCTCINNSCNRR